MRSVAALAGGAMLLGSCGGVMLSRFTVAGMNDFYFYDRSSFAYASPEPDRSGWADDYSAGFEPAAFDSGDGAHDAGYFEAPAY